MLIGYARVSTLGQGLDLQEDALKEAGCERVYTDVASGAKAARQGLDDALGYLLSGDTLVVWKLDRLGRSLSHLIEVVSGLHDRGVGFRALQEQMETTTSGGKLIFHVFGALAEFERGLVRERTEAGLKAARARGRLGGRPRSMTAGQVRQAAKLLADPDCNVVEVCQAFGVHRTTLYRQVKALHDGGV